MFEPQLGDRTDVDVAFLATPHGASMEIAPDLLARGIKVIDLSGDYRLSTPEAYEKWYGHPHRDPEGLSKAAYGMAELFRDRIARADLIANPGCYPTCSILSLAPLLAHGLVDDKVIIDAKSGTSGAGAETTKATHHPNCGATITPYKIVGHRHTVEIGETLSTVAGSHVGVVFTPHLLPIIRGMLTTSYVTLKKDKSKDELQALYDEYYRGAQVRPAGGRPVHSFHDGIQLRGGGHGEGRHGHRGGDGGAGQPGQGRLRAGGAEREHHVRHG